MKRSVLKAVSVASLIVAVVLLLPFAFARSSNCGGNSVALGLCRTLALVIRMELEDSDGRFDVKELGAETLTALTNTASSHWLERGNLWVRRTLPQHADTNLIVAVCTRAYDNVPQPLWWNGFKRTPAHAIAPLNGLARLIPPSEFAQLDLSDFVPVSSLTNSVSDKAP